MNFKCLFLSFVIISCLGTLNAQVVINEGSNRNSSTIVDEDGDTQDWIEIYNTADSIVSLSNWSISDSKSNPEKWIFPDISLGPNELLLLFASGKDRRVSSVGSVWESPVLPSDNFQYIVPTASIADWKKPTFDASNWGTGSAGFGYGDDDDQTIVPNGSLVVYIRKEFSIEDTSVLVDAVCHVDYDDGFVAYLNGTEICRSNINGTPTWNSTAAGNHEAVMGNGGSPETFQLDMDVVSSAWKEGKNVFAIEVHNVSSSSSDLSLVPFLSFRINGGASYFNPAPDWFTNSTNSYLHTNFKIAPEGETVRLYNAQRELMSMLDISNLMLDHSLGCDTDGSDAMAIFIDPTPGASNNTAQAYAEGYIQEPIFSIQAGYYSGSQELSIYTSSSDYEIRYTTDGSTPTQSSTLYVNTPITITSTQTINARCFASDQLPSKVRTGTYLIDEEYTIPVLSVTTDQENLFGSSGIFTNYNEEWNKPCYIEYFDLEKQLAISQMSGIQVDGGAGGSRSKPQTSFRIEPGNGKFGAGDVKYSFHPERPNRNSYSSLYLRNGSNRYLDLIYKDASQVRGMGKNTHNYYSEYRPIVVLINGEYYGVYEGREKINADYLENNYGVDTDSMDLVGISHFNQPRTILANIGSVEPFMDDYNRAIAMDPTNPNYLEEISTFLDIDNYTDYIAGQTWMTNRDWPHNNMKAWRCKGTDMRWQFAIIDLEWSFLPTNTSANLATTPDYDQIEFMKENATDWPASGYWYVMMENEEYKNYYINRLCDLMNTSYAYKELDKVETAIYREIIPEIPAYYLRWNGGSSYDFTSNHSTFNYQLSIRENYLRQHMRSHYSLNNDVAITLDVEPVNTGKIKISTITPDSYPWNGDYFSDVPIKIEAIPAPGYVFVGWEDNSYIHDTESDVFTCVIDATSTNFKAIFEKGESSFNGITISEINYKNGDDFSTTDWFEIWNSTDEELNMEGWYFTDDNPEHIYSFDTTHRIKAGERLVVAQDLAVFNIIYPDVLNCTGGFSFGLGTPTDEVRLYDANDELMAYVKYSDLFPWALSDDNTGRSLELLNPSNSLLEVENWFAGCYMGSPGVQYDPNCSSIPANILENVERDNLAIKAYPNPMQNDLTLELNITNVKHNTVVSIYNTMGTLVFQQKYDELYVGINKLNIDVSALQKNKIYYITVVSNETKNTIKVIKE